MSRNVLTVTLSASHIAVPRQSKVSAELEFRKEKNGGHVLKASF
jgi:hypothetical protein